MKDDRKVCALWTGPAAEEKGKIWRFPGSGSRYKIEENGSAVNVDKPKLSKAEKRAAKRERVADRKKQAEENADLLGT